jgi:hypothetical protein
MSNQIPKGTDVEGDMTPEEQRIAIAKACGWKCINHFTMYGMAPINVKQEFTPSKSSLHWKLPDYLNDLNEMHKAVETLFESSLYQDYWPMLDSIAQRDGNRGSSGRIAHTTAKQQAEAFLCVRNRDKS